MITVGLVKELYFISKILNREYKIQINPIWDGFSVAKLLEININPGGLLKVYYQTHHIWAEQVEGEGSFFGVESCDSISRIINCIDNNSPWEKYSFFSTDKLPT